MRSPRAAVEDPGELALLLAPHHRRPALLVEAAFDVLRQAQAFDGRQRADLVGRDLDPGDGVEEGAVLLVLLVVIEAREPADEPQGEAAEPQVLRPLETGAGDL